MSNMVSSYGIPNGPPQQGFGGVLPAGRELAVNRRFDSYSVAGTSSIERLTSLPRGTTFALLVESGLTFQHSDVLRCPRSTNYTASASELVLVRSDGNGAWRLYPIGAGDVKGANNGSDFSDIALVRNNIGLGNSADGWIGIDQPTPAAPLHIGAASTINSINAHVLISRTETRSGANAHGYSDSTDWNGSSSAAYCSYDARITASGSGTSDHFAAFQAAPTYGGTQTTSNSFDFYSAPTVSSGSTVTHRWGLYVGTAGGSGTIGDEVGVYVAPLERGTGTNYGLRIARTLGSGHVGQSTIDGITVGGSGGDYSSIGYNVTYTTTTGSHKYTDSDYASMIRFGSSGKIQTFTAVSGTAGNTISFTAGPEVVQAATSWSAPSSINLKKNVKTLDVLSRLEKFRAVEFDWKDPNRYPHDVGVIAQELVECFPEVVNEGAGDDPWSVEYDRLGAVALGGVKQLLEMVKEQARQIEELRAKIAG